MAALPGGSPKLLLRDCTMQHAGRNGDISGFPASKLRLQLVVCPVPAGRGGWLCPLHGQGLQVKHLGHQSSQQAQGVPPAGSSTSSPTCPLGCWHGGVMSPMSSWTSMSCPHHGQSQGCQPHSIRGVKKTEPATGDLNRNSARDLEILLIDATHVLHLTSALCCNSLHKWHEGRCLPMHGLGRAGRASSCPGPRPAGTLL